MRASVAEVVRPGSARARRRRRRADRVLEQGVLGRAQLRVGVEDRVRAAAGALEQLDVLGQPRELNCCEPGLADAEHLPLAAQLEVDLGELEAVAVLGERPQPARLLGPEQQAHRLVLAAADAPAQLVQLRDAVALGVLDEHHGRVRDVDADLDHGRGHEHVGAAAGERRHRLLLLARAHLAVQQHDAVVLAARRRAGARTRRSRRAPAAPRTPRPAGRPRTPGGRRRAPRGCARRRARARARWRPRSVSIGRRPGGQLAQDGDVEVAVGGQRERARDRRRGHVQHVRREPGRRLAVQRAALVDAEAVLLVDHRDREAVELDRVLDQRVRADQQLQLAGRELAEQVGAAARRASSRSAARPARARPASASAASRSAARRASRSAPSARPGRRDSTARSIA